MIIVTPTFFKTKVGFLLKRKSKVFEILKALVLKGNFAKNKQKNQRVLVAIENLENLCEVEVARSHLPSSFTITFIDE